MEELLNQENEWGAVLLEVMNNEVFCEKAILEDVIEALRFM